MSMLYSDWWEDFEEEIIKGKERNESGEVY